jgi:hypothetical protein
MVRRVDVALWLFLLVGLPEAVQACWPAEPTQYSYQTILTNNRKVMQAIENQRRKYAPHATSWSEMDTSVNGEPTGVEGFDRPSRLIQRAGEKVQIAGFVVSYKSGDRQSFYVAIHPKHRLPNMCETSPFTAVRLKFAHLIGVDFLRTYQTGSLAVFEGILGVEKNILGVSTPIMNTARIVRLTNERAIPIGDIGDLGPPFVSLPRVPPTSLRGKQTN